MGSGGLIDLFFLIATALSERWYILLVSSEAGRTEAAYKIDLFLTSDGLDILEFLS